MHSQTMVLSRDGVQGDHAGIEREKIAHAMQQMALEASQAGRVALDTRDAPGRCPLHAMFAPVGAVSPLLRWSTLVTGLVAYAMFLVTILYAIGFVSGLGVPKSINSGPSGNPIHAVLIDLALLGAFAVQHTVMARRGFKRWWTRIIPAPMERSLFVAAASAALMVLFWQWRPLPGIIWSVEPGVVHAGLVGISLSGWAIVFLASFAIDHLDLFGLRQMMRGFRGAALSQVEFKTAGLYRYVRHPLMVGFLIAFWVTPVMTAGHLLFATVTTIYILVGTAIEERDLYATLGSKYAKYAREVPGFIPRFRPVRKARGT